MRRAATIAIAWMLAALLLAGCGVLGPSDPNPTCRANAPGACTEIDGFPVGELTRDCQPDGLACGEHEKVAFLAFSMRDPNHAAIVGIAEHSIDMARVCGGKLCVISSFNTIFVFTLADGTRGAAAYQCQGVGPCFGTLHWGDFAGGVMEE